METLLDLLGSSVAAYGRRPSLKLRGAGGEGWDYARLDREATGAAAALRSRGVAAGDRVVIWGPNRPEWVAAYFGCLKAGAIAVPFDVRAGADFLDRVIERTRPRLVIAGPAQVQALGRKGDPLPLEDLGHGGDVAGFLPHPAAPGDIAEVVFTSGTTGVPKGVVLTHGNILSDVLAVRQRVPCWPHYRVLSLLPLSHMLEMTVGLLSPLAGGSLVVYVATLQPGPIFQAMQEEGITSMVCVPQVLRLFLEGIEREAARRGVLGRLRFAGALASRLPFGLRRTLFGEVHRRIGGRFEFFVCGGAALDPNLAAAWERMGVKVLQGYGMTEASPVVTCDTLDDRDHRAVGRPLAGVDVRVADDGEVLVRGPNVAPGYWEDPQATAAAFEGGFYRTGDLGRLSPQGRLQLIGRKKNIIVLSNGMNVYPEDLEALLTADPRVRDAVVLGLPEDGGAQVHAVLVMEEPEAAAGAVREVNRRVAVHQRIAGFTLWPEPDFPRTHTMKPLRAEIEAQVRAGARTAARVAANAGEVAR